MVHSVKNRKRRENKMKRLRKQAKGLAKLASHQTEGAVEMTLPYVALGDLRRRWRQRETPLHSALLRKLGRFERIKIPKDKPLHISGSDGGLLVYGVALNDVELLDKLYRNDLYPYSSCYYRRYRVHSQWPGSIAEVNFDVSFDSKRCTAVSQWAGKDGKLKRFKYTWISERSV